MKAKKKQLTISDIKRRLQSRHGFTEDEIDVTFKTEEALRDFYEKQLPKLCDAEEEGDKWSESKYELPADVAQEFEEKKAKLAKAKKERDEEIERLKKEAAKNNIPVSTTSELREEFESDESSSEAGDGRPRRSRGKSNIPAAEQGENSQLEAEAAEELKRLFEQNDFDPNLPNN